MRKKLFIAIDDTDELGYHTSTGKICEDISIALSQKYNTMVSRVTRHQLLFSDKIPYTSHNSSMCFEIYLNKAEQIEAFEYAKNYIRQKSAPSSDPGICMVFEDEIVDKKGLIFYGFSAKEIVLTKSVAYETAQKHNLLLKELGGSGLGIIGALAGVALRLYGSDGRVKGKFRVDKDRLTVKELVKRLSIDDVMTVDGKNLADEAIVITENELKMVYINHRLVLLVKKDGDLYVPLSKSRLQGY